MNDADETQHEGELVFGGGWYPDNPDGQVTLAVTMTEREAMALAQLAKRCSPTSFVHLASSGSEAVTMYEGMDGPVRRALEAEGFNPR